MKKCSRCKQTKLFSDFYKDARMKDGHYSACKSCSPRSKSTASTPEEKRRRRLRLKAWRKRHPKVREAEKRQHYKRHSATFGGHKSWTEDEKLRLFDLSLTDTELSALLGRSLQAIQVARVRFKDLAPVGWAGKATPKIYEDV